MGLGYPPPPRGAALGARGCSARAPSSRPRAPARSRPGEAACLLGGLGQAVTRLLRPLGKPGLRQSAVWLSTRVGARRRSPSGSRSPPPQGSGVFGAPSAGGKSLSSNFLTQAAALIPGLLSLAVLRDGVSAAWAWKRAQPVTERCPELGRWPGEPSCSPCPCPCPSGRGTRGISHELLPGMVQAKPFGSAG